MINWVHPPAWLKNSFPQMVWEIPTSEKEIYLTFDDGPTPWVTPRVLALLLEYKAKATFFCQGSKIEQYPDLFEDVKAAGHTIGNHGYRHLSGFSTSLEKYTDNAKRGEEYSKSKLFRPPYGRITPWQMNRLKKDYRLVMWNIMSMDFNRKLSAEKCLRNVTANIKPGSIVVFHDSEQARENVLQVLPLLLSWLDKNGYRTKTLEGIL